MKTHHLITCCAVAATLLAAPAPVTLAGATPEVFDQSHGLLDRLLQRHTTEGLMNYRDLLEDRELLRTYLGTLGELSPEAFASFTPDERLALYINAYNAFTLELILHHYPVASIRDIPDNWTEPRWLLLGRKISLDDLENVLIRGEFAEPRIHGALVCASLGCPALRAEAFTGEKLQEQLASAARDYARGAVGGRLDRKQATLHVSKVFEWFADDFAAVWGRTDLPAGSDGSALHRAVVGFFIAHLPADEAAYLKSNAVTLAYIEYDWRLNDATSE